MAIRQPITTKPMYLYLEDGIPTRATGFFNHNALYEVNIPQAGGDRGAQGTGHRAVRQRRDRWRGERPHSARPLTPSLEASAEGGAYGYGRLLVSGGATSGNNGVRADVNLTRSENWKQEAPFRRQSGTVAVGLRVTGRVDGAHGAHRLARGSAGRPCAQRRAVRHEPLHEPRAHRVSQGAGAAAVVGPRARSGRKPLERDAVRALQRHAAASLLAAHLRSADVGHEERLGRRAHQVSPRLCTDARSASSLAPMPK